MDDTLSIHEYDIRVIRILKESSPKFCMKLSPMLSFVNEITERYIEINRKAKINGKIELRSISIELVLKCIAQRENDELRIIVKRLVGIYY